MKLNTESWKTFELVKLFDVDAGKYYYKDDYSDGNTPYCSASAENNGVSKKIDISPDFMGNKIITGKVGCTAFYQSRPFCATSDVNVLTPKFDMTPEIGLFITTVINKNENYRWNYGRQCRVGDTKEITIKLPILLNSGGSICYDKKLMFSDKGYIPDWDWMTQYIKSLNYKPLSTANHRGCESHTLGVESWKPFKVNELFEVKYGINMELNTCIEAEDGDPDAINFVARTESNNGVSARVKPVEGKEPQPAGLITCAGGGSVLSTFLQEQPFYSGRDLYLLIPLQPMSKLAKLFCITVLKANKYRYNYGRQANITLPSLELMLPVDSNGRPDFAFMENYMKSLPYGDRI